MIYGSARQSGGHCRVHTVLGRGTRICFYLPRHVPPALEPSPRDQAVSESRPDPGRTARILMVEQNVTGRDVADEVLRDLGHTVVLAEDGAAALRLIEAGKPIDLILTDIGLPGGTDGQQLAARVREVQSQMKVLFITGYADEAEAAASLIGTGSVVLPKPFKVQALADRLASMLGEEIKGPACLVGEAGPRIRPPSPCPYSGRTAPSAQSRPRPQRSPDRPS